MSDLGRAVVRGPVKGGSHGWAFGRPSSDLARHGYREDEFFIEGLASRFAPSPGTELGRDGRWRVQPVEAAPYKTRLIVLRPEDPAAFNGTVVMCWNNVSAGYDGFRGGDSLEILEGGYAYVAVSAQRVGVHGLPKNPQGLIAWDGQRYGSLAIPSDDYSFDIFTQVAQAVSPARGREPVDPMGDLEVRNLVAQGSSQSAGRLATYLNAVQPLAGVIDGFILSLYFGTGAPLEVGDAVVSLPPPGSQEAIERATLVGTHLLRDDLDVPVMVVNSECESMACFGVRQPDTDRYRYWEVAGTCHVSLQMVQKVAFASERDFGVTRPAQVGINEVPMAPVDDAAFHHMHRWVQGGGPPPIQPRIDFGGDPPEIIRDENGIARGGIRLPQVEVPIAHNSAIPRTADIWGRLGGTCLPFPSAKLHDLYGDGAGYVARFEQAARAAEKLGVILPRDTDALTAETSANLSF
jgi:hypothetical protein